MTAPGSLTNGNLDPLWAAAKDRLERHGLDNRGRLRLIPLVPAGRHALDSLLGRRAGTTVDLAALESALVTLGIGRNLADALGELGHPVSLDPQRRREGVAAGHRTRAAARAEAAQWREPWASEWIEHAVNTGTFAGLDEDEARGLVRSVRVVLDHLDGDRGAPLSRVDLAAQVLGSAHALDSGTRLEAAITRALAHRHGPAEARELWEMAGAHLDLTSGPALCWRLPLDPHCGLAPLAEQAAALGIPLHLSQLALRRHPVRARPGAEILVVENPRIVEAAAQTGLEGSFIAANGNPSGAVRLLLGQLLDSGAALRYHGDFDEPGIAMCRRMVELGLTPWRMDATDYLAALRDAARSAIELPRDPRPAGPTPWDRRLEEEFDRHRLVVHEERLLPHLLGEAGWTPSS
ncbi:MAG: DUF2399 domain-containing protein [Acidimicrobiia bacterium]|nr:DUF2399 domain-containing protein [Acidimicrobiia bacterium]